MQPSRNAASRASNRFMRLPRFESMRPAMVSAIPRKPSNFSSKVHFGMVEGLAPDGWDNDRDEGHLVLIPARGSYVNAGAVQLLAVDLPQEIAGGRRRDPKRAA
jgi:hypothetical protein